MSEKNWTERFETAQQKPKTWRVAVGLIILLVKVSSIIQPHTSNDVLGRLDLYPSTNAEALGYDLASTLLWLAAVWLIVSGLQSRKVVLPSGPK